MYTHIAAELFFVPAYVLKAVRGLGLGFRAIYSGAFCFFFEGCGGFWG